ncbi:MAG: hypothetical protein ACOYL9_14285 [Ilumatobacteraceae bacterium]
MRLALTALLVVCVSTACGQAQEATGEVAKAIDAPIAAADQGIQAIDAAQSFTCTTDRSTIQTAMDAYFALEGSTPTESQLLESGLIRSVFKTWDIDAAGNVVPAPGSPCT